jgi:hypothetical protein
MLIFRADASPEPSLHNDDAIERSVQAFLTTVRPSLTRLVAGELSFASWSPSGKDLSPEIIKHLVDLKIPSPKGKPNLLLHNLGSFAGDERLSERIQNIFMPYNHT